MTMTVDSNFLPANGTDYIITRAESKNISYMGYNYSGKLPYVNPDVYIKEVIYSDPATIVFWSDGTKTISKCRYPDVYSKETGLSLCILKKILGGVALRHLLEDWIPKQESFAVQKITLRDIIKKNK